MWTCPKCGREFKRTNQGHYCGKAPETVEEYIDSQVPETRPYLAEIADIIRRCIPEVKERIAWSMPTFEKDRQTVSFYACKNHISFYVGKETIEKFASELSEFSTNKSAVYLPYNKELPRKLIKDMVKTVLRDFE